MCERFSPKTIVLTSTGYRELASDLHAFVDNRCRVQCSARCFHDDSVEYFQQKLSILVHLLFEARSVSTLFYRISRMAVISPF